MSLSSQKIIEVFALVGIAAQAMSAAVSAHEEGLALVNRLLSEGRDPTPEELSALEGRVDRLSAELNAPIRSEQG